MNKKIMALLVASFIISYFVFIQIGGLLKQQPMQEDEIRTRVENLYAASVQSIVTKEQTALVSFTTDKGLYEVAIDRETGRPSNLLLVHETNTYAEQPTDKEEVAVGNEETPAEDNKQPTNTPNENAKPNTETPTQQPASTIISEQQAIQIALKEQPGELDNVDYKETNDGGYYEIEIEHGDAETTFIIHAITGKILAVSFDD